MRNRVGTRRRHLEAAIALALAGGVAGAAEAATSATYIVGAAPIVLASPAGDTSQLSTEVAALQSALAKKTAEISALKRANRGVRDDYELRRRMAEANEIARRLTALEAELSVRRGKPSSTGAAGGSPTERAPVPAAEAASALAARADLLSDEARKLSQRAAGMIQAAGQLRARQAMRRRAFNVERDAFSGLDGARRVLPARPTTPTTSDSSAAAPISGSGATEMATPPTTPPPGGTATPPSTTTGNSPPPNTGGGASLAGGPAPATGSAGAAPPPPSMPAPATTTPPPATTPEVGGTRTSDPGGPGQKTNPNTSLTAGSKTEVAPGTLLDPSLRSELARIEAAGAGGTDADALMRAAAALSGRAQALEAEAKTLRDRAARR
jgi:hypothetical protein